MEALQIFTTAACMAGTVGPLIGLVTLVFYRLVIKAGRGIGRRGLVIKIGGDQ